MLINILAICILVQSSPLRENDYLLLSLLLTYRLSVVLEGRGPEEGGGGVIRVPALCSLLRRNNQKSWTCPQF